MVIRQRFGGRKHPSKGMNVTDKAFTVKEFEQTHKIGHTKACEEIKSGRLASYKVGRRRYISDRAAEEWQRNLEAENANLVADSKVAP